VLLAAAKAQHPAHYIALELGHDETAARLVSIQTAERETGVGFGAINRWNGDTVPDGTPADRTGRALDETTAGRVLAAEEVVEGLGDYLTIDCADALGGFSAKVELEAFAERAKTKGGKTPIAVLDFLQLVRDPNDPKVDIRLAMTAAAYQARNVARKTGMVVLLVMSTARSNYAHATSLDGDKFTDPTETKEGKRKSAEHLVGLGKESGDIEYSLSTLIAFVRGPKVQHANRDRTLIDIGVAKDREGPGGWSSVTFAGAAHEEIGARSRDVALAPFKGKGKQPSTRTAPEVDFNVE